MEAILLQSKLLEVFSNATRIDWALVGTVGVTLLTSYIAWRNWLQNDKDKHKMSLQNELDRQKVISDAEVEKHRISAKENSVGAEAVVQLWKFHDKARDDWDRVEGEIAKAKESQAKDHEAFASLSEAFKIAQADVKRIMDLIFEKWVK